MPDVQLLLNYPFPEKANAPWSVLKTAHGMTFSHMENGVYFDGALRDELWQEPNTGILTLKPTFLSKKRLDPANLTATWILPSAINYGGTSAGGVLYAYAGSTQGNSTVDASYQAASPKLVSVTDERVALSVDGGLNGFLGRAEFSAQNLVWSMQTQVQLQANQGFAVMYSPASTYADFANTYFAIAFGGKLILEVQMAGTANLWGDVDGTGNYVKIDSYPLKDGGTSFLQPVQISVIPLGKRFLSVSFTSNPPRTQSAGSPSIAKGTQSFLTVLRGQGPYTSANNLEPYWDNSLNQWVKYDAAPLTLALAKNDFDYHFLIAQAYYPEASTAHMSKEYLPEQPTWNGSTGVNYYKLTVEGQTEAAGGSAAYTDVALLDQTGAPYAADSGRPLVSAIGMYPSETGVYTPELHAYGVSYPPNVSTPDWTPIDVSANWQMIRFMRTCDANAQRVEIKLLRDQDYQTLLKGFGPCRLNVYDNSGNLLTLCDFYAERNQPTSEGPSQLITDQFEGLDMWDRLNNSPLLIETVLEGDLIVNSIQQAIIDAGFTSDQVYIDYTNSPELASLTFGKFTNPNDLLRPNSDSSCGDFIRNVQQKLGVQFSPPLRVRWVTNPAGGMYWRIYFGPIYKTTTTYTHGAVQHRFFLDDSLIPSYSSEQARFVGHDFTFQSAPEWTVLRPPFNAILAKAAKGVDGKEGAEVRYIAPPAAVINDPSYIGFEGGERVKQLATEQLQIAQTADSVELTARHYYEQNYNLKRFRLCEGSGEWQPEIDADDFVAVIGRAKIDDPNGTYSKGDPVCYGAYRIEHIDIEMRSDFTVSNAAASRWEWTGSYTMVYVGPYTDPSFWIKPLVMFTGSANLPDDYDLPS